MSVIAFVMARSVHLFSASVQMWIQWLETNSYNIIKYSGEANVGTRHHKLQRLTQHSTFFKNN